VKTGVNVATRFVFGDHELHVARVQLLRRGAVVPIQRKPLFLLMYLLENPGRTVPSTELVREVWKGVSVTDASLRRAVRVLRQTLGNDGTYVESVRGFGYRFAASVERGASLLRIPPIVITEFTAS
jgi:DNA-binding winged helix-turn-helix (wHTH) protein